MIEVEAKYRINDIKHVEKKILDLGAIYVGEEYEEDYYFQHPCRDFMKTDEALRIRKTTNKVEMTYKGPKISNLTKSRVEINVGIEDLDSAIELLERLGFKKVFVVKKHRRKYKLSNNVKISIDIVEDLGSFIEIEVATEKHKFHEAEEKVLNIAKSLGLKGKPIIKSYLELLLEKKANIYGGRDEQRGKNV